MADLSIEDILEQARPREEVARVCIDGRLLGRHAELVARLDALPEATTLTGSSPDARALADEIRAVEAEMEAKKVTFRFAGISAFAREAIQRRFPLEGQRFGWDSVAGAHAYIAACAVEPKMTEDQAKLLLERLNDGAANELFAAARTATEGATIVPNSVRASALTSGTGSK